MSNLHDAWQQVQVARETRQALDAEREKTDKRVEAAQAKRKASSDKLRAVRPRAEDRDDEES
jgi:hypothetical protein